MQSTFDKIASGLNDAIAYQRALREDVSAPLRLEMLGLAALLTLALLNCFL